MAQWRTPPPSPDIHQLIQEIRSSVITSTWTFSADLGENYGECCLMHVSCQCCHMSRRLGGNNDNMLSHEPRGGGCQQHLMMVTSHHQPHCILMTHLCRPRTKNTAVSADSALLGCSLCECYKYSAAPAPAPVEL